MGLQEVDACEKKMVKANCDGQEYENVRALHFHFSCGIFIFGLTTAQVNIMNLKLVPPQAAGVCVRQPRPQRLISRLIKDG